MITDNLRKALLYGRITPFFSNIILLSLISAKGGAILNPVHENYPFTIDGPYIRVRGGGQPAVQLQPGDNCILTVNGSRVSNFIEVGPADAITWQGAQQSSPPFKITVSQDKTQVFVTVLANCYFTWVAQAEPAPGGYVVHCKEQPDPERRLTAEDVIRQFEEQQFKVRPDVDAIKAAIEKYEAKQVLIASGKPAVPGRDGYIEPHFSLDEEMNLSDQTGDTLNYREKRRIPVIHEGELMATVHPPVPGQAGLDVWGQPITPPPVREVSYRLRKHVYKKGQKVYAQITGRPSYIPGKNAILEVVPVYTVPGDVNLDTGHIRFAGDVVVNGNVTETMQVFAGQRIVVHGSVYNAELRAGGSIHVDRTISQSRVQAGLRGTFARQLRPPLKKLHKQATSIEQSRLRLVEQAQKPLPDHLLLRRLINDYYPDFLKYAKEVAQLFTSMGEQLSSETMPEDLKPLQIGLNQLLQELETTVNLQTWQAFLSEIALCLREKLDACLQDETLVTQTADVSHLQVHGDIVFTGKGSTQCHCIASRRIMFSRADAACRGGHLEAGEEIVAGNIGSLIGSKTFCKAGKRIAAHTVQHTDIHVAGRVEYVEHETEIEFYKEADMTLTRVRT